MPFLLPATQPRLLGATHPVVPSRRAFLRYSGAGAALGGLWLAGCKKEDAAPTPPTLNSFSPASGMPGATITLTGTNFAGATAVLLGTVATTFTVVSATSITFMVPAAATSGTITVTTPAGSVASASAFTVTAAPSTAPTLNTLGPTSALPGATILFTGTNLTGVTAVTVAGIPAASFRIIGANSFSFVVPATAQSSVAQAGALVVTGPTGTATTAANFTILATTIAVGTADAGVLNYAYALEQLEAAFYTQLRTGTYYTSLASNSAEKQVLDDLYYHEVIHREFLKVALTAAGATPLKDLTVDFSSIDFSSRTSVLTTAKAFEDLGSAAYIGAAQYITTPAYLFIAGKIASVEARHAALIRDFVTEGTFVGSDIIDSNSSLEIAKKPSVVAPVVNTYLALGSKLDVAGLG